MSSTSGISQFSTGLWLDLGQPTDLSALSISGWVTQPQTLGRLNSYVGTCYTGIGYTGSNSWDYDVGPDLTNGDYSILGQMFMVTYYNQLVRKCAGAGGTQKIVQSLAEGDSRVQYVNAADLARVYTENVKEATKTLNYLVNTYNTNSQGAYDPRSVNYYTILPRGANQNFGKNW
jgi:hypothetical protein